MPHSALKTLSSALRILHSALRMPHSALRLLPSALRMPHSAPRLLPSALRMPHSALRILPSALRILPSALAFTLCLDQLFYLQHYEVSTSFRKESVWPAMPRQGGSSQLRKSFLRKLQARLVAALGMSYDCCVSSPNLDMLVSWGQQVRNTTCCNTCWSWLVCKVELLMAAREHLLELASM